MTFLKYNERSGSPVGEKMYSRYAPGPGLRAERILQIGRRFKYYRVFDLSFDSASLGVPRRSPRAVTPSLADVPRTLIGSYGQRVAYTLDRAWHGHRSPTAKARRTAFESWWARLGDEE